MSVTPSKGYCSSYRGSNAPGAFYEVRAADFGGIQPALPSIPAGEYVDYYFIVPNTGAQWKVQKHVSYMNPDGSIENPWISLSSLSCESPLYPGTSQTLSGLTYIVLNGTLYSASSGTTASTFIGAGAFNQSKGATTTDGSVTWTSLGKAVLVRVRFSNIGLAAGSPPDSGETPVAQEYDLFQL